MRVGGATEDLAETRPRQADLHHGVAEMQRRQPRGAEHAVLLLRMLQDQHRHLVLDRHDAGAHAQRHRLVTLRAIRGGAGRFVRDGLRGQHCYLTSTI